jgi:hypothetical protein
MKQAYIITACDPKDHSLYNQNHNLYIKKRRLWIKYHSLGNE